MRHRPMEGDDMPLKLDEIHDETNQLDVSRKIKRWLSTESLRKNQKIHARESDHETLDYGPEYTYLFNPPYNIKIKKLLRLLHDYDQKDLVGVFMEDLQE